MAEAPMIICVLLLVAVIVLVVLVLRKRTETDLSPLESAMQATHERTTRTVGDEFARNREESGIAARQAREEIAASIKHLGESLLKTNAELGRLQQEQLTAFAQRLDRLTGTIELQLREVRSTVETRLATIQADNARQLEQMRQTVDEKLQGTLQQRLSESFKLVSERLDAVARGLGEMQALAAGVGDLKKVLTNVKTRGTWGEVQLGAMLEQVLTPDQYLTNAVTRPGAGERVEFAIKLPGRGDDRQDLVLLPIDAKFPVEDYQRLVEAQERSDGEAAELAARQLETRIKACAADICQKYIAPPHTTDFGILYLPTEGLFAEVIRRTGLAEYVQRECRVVIAGPTTLWSILNSLQMGFRTLAIQQRSSDVWKLLGAIKAEWGKYGAVLDKVQKRLQQASDEIDNVAVRTRAIDKALQKVEQLPSEEADEVLMLESAATRADD